MVNALEKESKLKSDVDYIVANLLDFLPSKPKAILLCGGYGRDEGAWLVKDGKVTPYNDYDFSIITDCLLEYDRINAFRRKMAQNVGISWVDLDFYTEDKIKHLKSTIKNVDLLYGSKIVYGSYDFSDPEKKVKAVSIGESDVFLLYQTRIWTFLGSWNGDFKDLGVEETRFFKNQMAKAVLAAVDMLLIKVGKYTPSYRERVSIVKNLYSSDESLCHLAKWAIVEKMNPSSDLISKDAMKTLYFEVKELFIKALKVALPEKFDFFLNPDKTICFYKKYRHYYLRILYEIFYRRKTRFKKTVLVFLAQNYVFHAIERNGLNKKYLKKAAHILKRYGYIDDIDADVHEVRKMAAFARNNI